MKLSDLVDTRSKSDPSGIAFVNDGSSLSRAAFASMVEDAIRSLKMRGIGRGDAVAVWLVNSPQWIAIFIALARLGAITVPINTRYRSEEVAHLLNTGRVRLLLTQARHQKFDPLLILSRISPPSVPSLLEVCLIDAGAGEADACAWPLTGCPRSEFRESLTLDDSNPDDVTILFSTSGTTKAPKLVMHPQRTLTEHAHLCAESLGLNQPDAVLLAMLPMCGVFGLNSVLAAMAAGTPVVVQDVFDAKSAAELMRVHRVTHAFGSDEMFRRLAEATPGPKPFPAAKFFGFGAFTSSFGPFAHECVERGMPLHGLYGSSEVLALFSAQPQGIPLEERLKGGGLPMAHPRASIRVRDTDTGELVPTGESGELEIKAPTNFIGYFNNEEASEKALRDGYFLTGDLGYLRGDGTFVFVSRLGDAMRLGGHLVNPAEIEEILKRHDGIEDAHVVTADVDGQPRAVAFVILERGAELIADEITQKMGHSIARFKVPARIWAIDAFPQTPGVNGVKTSRVQLRSLAIDRIKSESSSSEGSAS